MNKLVAGKASVLVLTAVLAVSAFLLGRSLSTVSAIAGTAGLGDQCDVVQDSDDESHNCAPGLICVEQGQGNGNGFCQALSTGTPTPTSSPTASPTPTNEPTATPSCEQRENCPTPSPEPTSTPNGDVCANLDGIQTGLPEGYHFDNDGVNCLKFEYGGPSNGGGSAPQGQVLGASTMAGTGSFTESLYLAIMAMGGALTAKGLKNFKKAFKRA